MILFLDSKIALENYCKDVLIAGKCNYTYVLNTIAFYDTKPETQVLNTSRPKSIDSIFIIGIFFHF